MEDYVTYKQAKALKEIGFNLECFFPYTDGKIVRNHPCPINWNNHGYTGYELISAPTLAQAQKWLREVKNIVVLATCNLDYEKGHEWYWFVDKDFDIEDPERLYETYEQALSAGIDKALEFLK